MSMQEIYEYGVDNGRDIAHSYDSAWGQDARLCAEMRVEDFESQGYCEEEVDCFLSGILDVLGLNYL